MLWKIKSWLLLALLTGCASSPPEKEYVTVYKDRPVTCIVPELEVPNFLPVTLDKVFSDEGEWWITVDDDNNKKIALNNGRILKYLTDLKANNEAYKSCINKKES